LGYIFVVVVEFLFSHKLNSESQLDLERNKENMQPSEATKIIAYCKQIRETGTILIYRKDRLVVTISTSQMA
jgi:hypothetical protein